MEVVYVSLDSLVVLVSPLSKRDLALTLHQSQGLVCSIVEGSICSVVIC